MVGVGNTNSVGVRLGTVVQVGSGVNVSVGKGVDEGKLVGGKVLVAAGPVVAWTVTGVAELWNGLSVAVGVSVVSNAL